MACARTPVHSVQRGFPSLPHSQHCLSLHKLGSPAASKALVLAFRTAAQKCICTVTSCHTRVEPLSGSAFRIRQDCAHSLADEARKPIGGSKRECRTSAVTLDTVNTSQKQVEGIEGLQNPASLRVYIILVPLDLPNGLLAAAVDFTRVAFKQRMEHAMTLVESPGGKCVCFDFRPVDPENPAVCFTLLTGRTSPGILRQSRLSRRPRKNCWLVGESNRSIEEAIEFHNKWDSQLHLVRNNCYTHTDALVEHLTGQPKILETLQLGAQKRLVEVFPNKGDKLA